MSNRKNDEGRNWLVIPFLGIPAVALLFTAVVWIGNHRTSVFKMMPQQSAGVAESLANFYSQQYPENTQFTYDLKLLRETGKLSQENEIMINKMIVNTSHRLQMPSGLLWCLLFQESRFNHLVGINQASGAKGLGQFSYFGFYEINHHLTRYTDTNLQMFKSTLGGDVRPVVPDGDNTNNPSSYFYIPTAVASSAAYLNNRYIQLKRNLVRKGHFFDPNLLWLYAAMAYNKGTRSVLSFWNNASDAGGQYRLYQLLVDPEVFLNTIENPALYVQALERIWERQTAERYAEELVIHMQRMKECALPNDERNVQGLPWLNKEGA